MKRYVFRTDPALMRLALAYADRHGINPARLRFGVQYKSVQLWLLERSVRGPDWPTLEDDARWRETADARRRESARLQGYRLRRMANGDVPILVDGTGTRRRIRALMAIGHSSHAIAALGHWADGEGVLQVSYRPRVTPSVRDLVAQIYDQLCMTPGTSSRTRIRAERAGWAPPLAWDDIDDLHELPANYIVEDLRRIRVDQGDQVDAAVVLRILDGDVLPSTRAEREEIVRRWHLNTGQPLAELGRRLGIKPEKYSGEQVAS